MTDDQLRKALRALADELENATARCKAEVESIGSDPGDIVEELNNLVDEILEDSEKAPKAGFLIVSVEAIEALRLESGDVDGEIESGFENFAWETRKALREFKEALTRQTADRAHAHSRWEQTHDGHSLCDLRPRSGRTMGASRRYAFSSIVKMTAARYFCRDHVSPAKEEELKAREKDRGWPPGGLR